MKAGAATPEEVLMKKGNNGGSQGNNFNGKNEAVRESKPPFRPAPDDTKPVLKDPILRSDPIETEEAVLRLPPFPIKKMES